jgi:5'-nucleotidase/UDP-sugar diphosphatase
MRRLRLGRLAALTALLASTFGVATASAAPARVPSLTVADSWAYERNSIVVPVTLDSPATRDIQVLGVPVRGTARPGVDYNRSIVRTVIPRGATTGQLIVQLTNDTVIEPDRSFTLVVGALGVRVRDGLAALTIRDDDTPLTVNLLHINDHHSNLQPTTQSLNVGTAGGAFSVPYGGFPRVAAKIAELDAQLDNVVKIHAGDAITGTLFYTLFKGQADAALMNTVCFDIFELGNHEFDDSDLALKGFLDFLAADPACTTSVLGANVVPQVGTPLAPVTPTDYIQPFVVKEFQGQQVGFVGIDIADKTRFSSQPLETTQFLDEVTTAQRYIDDLSAIGVDNIVLVTHYGYGNDLALAAQLRGVDAIVGGDSHSLLGDLAKFGLPSEGAYPTMATNADGDRVCVVQAWQYSWVVGQLGVTFKEGAVDTCGGVPHVLLGDTFTRGNPAVAVAEPERSAILAAIDADPQLGIVTPDPAATTVLNGYSGQVATLNLQQIGTSAEVFCDRRVPSVPRGVAPCNGNAVSASGAQVAVNGGFSQQIVTDAFLARAFRADIALQNGGGVRIAIPAGPITIGTAYTLLPFNNTLVELELTGAEVLASVEDALAFYAANPSGNTGAFPYGSAIRWNINMNQPRGQRISNVEVRDRATGVWGPIDPAATYTVVTNSFLAGGGDGAVTFKAARDAGRFTDTFINYAQGFYDYVQQDLGGVSGTPLAVPAPANFSTQSFIPLAPPAPAP